MLFDSDFEVVLANTEESKKLHYALRYQVYCQEMQYEDAAQFADQMEKDELDTSSVHFIVRAKRTGEWLAAIRFIVGELETLPTYNLLPAGSFHQQRMAEGVRCSGARVALEISRMCILGSYRKTGASLSSHDGCSNIYGVQRQRQPEVLLGLMRTAYAYCLSKQINICLFTITRSLARVMQNFKLNFMQAAEEMDYHGKRAPHYTHIPNFLGNVHLKSQSSYEMFVRDQAYRLYDAHLPEMIPAALLGRAAFASNTNTVSDSISA